MEVVNSLLGKLLGRGDQVTIVNGRLVIVPLSGKPVPDEWLAENKERLVREVLELSGNEGFFYVGHSVGSYGKRKQDGITLQFSSILSDRTVYAVFNVGLKRDRNTQYGKKGDPLPKGKFKVGAKSAFHVFWVNTGIDLPRRRVEFCECMGRLKGLVFKLNSANDDRVQSNGIAMVSVGAEALCGTLLARKSTGNIPTINRQSLGNFPARRLGKGLAPAHAQQGIQPISTTGPIKYGNTVIRKNDNTVSFSPPLMSISTPNEQSVDDWLKDFERADSI